MKTNKLLKQFFRHKSSPQSCWVKSKEGTGILDLETSQYSYCNAFNENELPYFSNDNPRELTYKNVVLLSIRAYGMTTSIVFMENAKNIMSMQTK